MPLINDYQVNFNTTFNKTTTAFATLLLGHKQHFMYAIYMYIGSFVFWIEAIQEVRPIEVNKTHNLYPYSFSDLLKFHNISANSAQQHCRQ